MIGIEIKGKGCLKLKPKQIKGSLVSKLKAKDGLKLWLTPQEGVPAIQSPCHPHVTPIKGMAGHNFETQVKMQCSGMIMNREGRLGSKFEAWIGHLNLQAKYKG